MSGRLLAINNDKQWMLLLSHYSTTTTMLQLGRRAQRASKTKERRPVCLQVFFGGQMDFRDDALASECVRKLFCALAAQMRARIAGLIRGAMRRGAEWSRRHAPFAQSPARTHTTTTTKSAPSTMHTFCARLSASLPLPQPHTHTNTSARPRERHNSSLHLAAVVCAGRARAAAASFAVRRFVYC